MKIIVSHDIDHLSVKEHIFKDLIIPKYIIWSLLELIKRKISLKAFFTKIAEFFRKNAWNNLEELLSFNRKNGIKSIFFVAVNSGKGLNYSLRQAKKAIDLIKKYDFDIGVHGICYDNYDRIGKEYKIFKRISGLEKFGIRMHYLRLNKDTLENLAKVEYLFDATILSHNLGQEYNIAGMKEFPFHIMDVYLLGPQIDLTLEQAKEKTIELLKKAEKENRKYFAVLFHQRYFGGDFLHYKNWYVWLATYCHENKYEFANYKSLL